MKKIAKILIGTAALLALSGGTLSVLPRSAQRDSLLTYAKSVEGNKSSTGKESGLNLRAKAAYVMDFRTNTPVYAQNERAHLPIASMCKIMTLLLAFEAIDEGNLRMDEEILISERAASMGGSQVFLEMNAKYPVKELLKSIIVCSANDSCVAMAERIAGGEEFFVRKMNEKAKELGANDTLFANCTGLPKEPQYSCAQDVAVMLKSLLQHEEYFTLGKVWLDKFQHPKGRYTEITNTNKLVRFYDGCDGGKTGFTNEAGFCLAATAKRGDLRVISVVIGEESSQNRFEDVKKTFDYTFANYAVQPIVEKGVPLERQIAVHGGKAQSVAVAPERSAYAFGKRGEKSNVTYEICADECKAPIVKEEKVGELVVYKEGVEVERIPLLALKGVEKATVFDRFQEIAKEWNKRK